MTEKCCCEVAGACFWRQTVTTDEGVKACQAGAPLQDEMPLPCIYLGKQRNEESEQLRQSIYDCTLYDICTIETNRHRIRSCADCKSRLPLHTPDIATKYIDPLLVTDRNGKKNEALANMLGGGAAFLVCGGPSIKQVDYMRLGERGIFSLGVNNVAGYVPCSAFVCSDPPSKFHWGIYFDPNVMKFLPVPKLKPRRGQLRMKRDNEFHDLSVTTNGCPNIWGFQRRSWLTPDETWFTTPEAAWGNHKEGVVKTGLSKTVNTMLLGLRLLQYLGARTIFLLGVDFYMDPTRSINENYAFGERRDGGACSSNNKQYRVVTEWLIRLRPVFERFGFETYNCNIFSQLPAFDYVPFEDALEVCRGIVPREPFDLQGWYEKQGDEHGKDRRSNESSEAVRAKDMGRDSSGAAD